MHHTANKQSPLLIYFAYRSIAYIAYLSPLYCSIAYRGIPMLRRAVYTETRHRVLHDSAVYT